MCKNWQTQHISLLGISNIHVYDFSEVFKVNMGIKIFLKDNCPRQAKNSDNTNNSYENNVI